MYHHDPGHTGFDSSLPTASSATPGWSSASLDGDTYAAPLVYNGIVYQATLNNTVYAINQADGSFLWYDHLRAPTSSGWSCGDVSPQGIVGTPVIDTAAGRIYVATLGSDNLYRLEGLNLATGAVELSTIITTFAATGFDWTIEQERGALALANGYVYVPFGGRAGDCGNYHGWIFAVPTNGGPVTHYYATPGQGAGFWAAGGVVVDPSTGNVFDTSGNGTGSGCDANPDGTPVYENDAVVELSPTLAHLGAFIPSDWQSNWCDNDQDLGSASMVLISPTLAFQAGKWGNGFLVNPQNLGGVDGQLYPSPQPASYTPVDVCLGNHSDANFGSYAYAAPYVYLSCEGYGLVALDVNTSTPSFSACGVSCASPSWNVGSFQPGPPIVAGGAVWVVGVDGSGLYGFDAATGAEIYHSAGFGVNHFTTLSEAGGQIFVAAGTQVLQFVMTFCTGANISPSTATQAAGTTVNLTASSTGCSTPQYEFWVQYPDGSWNLKQGFGGPAFSWNTTGLAPGTYLVHAWVSNTGTGHDAIGSATVTLTGCSTASLSPPTPSQPAGSTVGLTASSTGCPTPEYEFWVQYPNMSWNLLQSFGGASFNWNTSGLAPGTYLVHAWVNNTGTGHDAIGSATVTLTGCTLASISPPSPTLPAGSLVSLTASSAGCPNPVYEFWVQFPNGTWNLKQGFSSSAAFNWDTTGLAAGTYVVHAWANQQGAATALEVFGSSTVTLTNCTTASLTPPSPSAPAGSTVGLIASSTGCLNPQYEYWVQYPNGTWNLIQGFSSSTAFNWNTSGLAPGLYTVHAWASSTGAGHEAIGSASVTLTGCTSASVSPPSPISQAAGTTVSLTGSAVTCPTPTFEWFVQYPNGTWNLKQAWAGAGFDWDTSGLAPGLYTVHAWANQQGASLATWESIGSASVTLTGCTSATASPSLSSPRPVGTSITFTAGAVGCSPAVFEFWLQYPDGTWHLEQAWSTTASWLWSTTGLPKGTYTLHVWTNQQGASTATFETIGSASFTLN